MALSKRLRYEILRRDNHTCRYCGAAAPDVKLTVDHVIPQALGGSDEPSNLVSACSPCNAGKSASSPDAPIVADVDQRARVWAIAMQMAAEERAAEQAHQDAITAEFRAIWNTWVWTDFHGVERPFELPADYEASVLRFLAAGLTMADLERLVKVAMGHKADRWRYFCGCCWRRIRDLQDRAFEIATDWEEQFGGE